MKYRGISSGTSLFAKDHVVFRAKTVNFYPGFPISNLTISLKVRPWGHFVLRAFLVYLSQS